MRICTECGEDFDYCSDIITMGSDCALCEEMKDTQPDMCESCYFGEEEDSAEWYPRNN